MDFTFSLFPGILIYAVAGIMLGTALSLMRAQTAKANAKALADELEKREKGRHAEIKREEEYRARVRKDLNH